MTNGVKFSTSGIDTDDSRKDLEKSIAEMKLPEKKTKIRFNDDVNTKNVRRN